MLDDTPVTRACARTTGEPANRGSVLRMILRRAGWGVLALVAATTGCFDSDEKFSAIVATSTGDPTTSTTTTGTTTSTTTDGTSSTTSDATCRDAITCIFQCAAMIQAQQQADPSYEPDFSCFLECEEQLPVMEAYRLIKLGNCAAEECAMNDGPCAPPEDPTGTSDSGSTTSVEPPPPDPGGLVDPCISCIFTIMLDEDYPGCQEFAMECV